MQQKQLTLFFLANATGESRTNSQILNDNLDIPAILFVCMDVPTQFKVVVDVVAWIINNLTRHKLVNIKELAMIMAIIKYILNNFQTNYEAFSDAANAIANLLGSHYEQIPIIAKDNLIGTLLNLISQTTAWPDV